MKTNVDIQVHFILECLRNGEKRKDIMAKFAAKWGVVSKNTFDRRLKTARGLFASELEIIKNAAKERIGTEADKLVGQIMTQLERQQTLTRIAKGEIEIPVSELKYDPSQKKFVKISSLELPSHTARISAIQELNKMDGSYSPVKQDITTGGEPLTATVRIHHVKKS